MIQINVVDSPLRAARYVSMRLSTSAKPTRHQGGGKMKRPQGRVVMKGNSPND